MLSNGKTAMDAFSDNGVDGTHHLQALKPARSTSKTAIMKAAQDSEGSLASTGLACNRPLRRIQASIWSCRVRSIWPRIRWCRLPKLDLRGVRSLRQINANGIALAVGVIVFAKLLTQAGGLDAHEGVGRGVKRLGTIEDFQSDVVTLQPLTAPSQISLTRYSKNRCRRCDWWNGPLLRMRTSCSRMAFWSDSLQELSEIAVTFQLQTCRKSATTHHFGVQFHTVTY